MRASRLLRILLILQNRGRQTSTQLAAELECAPRTILRDVDAMTEAGLPIIVHQGNQGGIELGFNYRTRLTGLAADEAEAFGIITALPRDTLRALGREDAAARALDKLTESFPDPVRARIAEAKARFHVTAEAPPDDPRIPALAEAIRQGRTVRLRARSQTPLQIRPTQPFCTPDGWAVAERDGTAIPQSDWGDINISMRAS